jgi:hypothetical protein
MHLQATRNHDSVNSFDCSVATEMVLLAARTYLFNVVDFPEEGFPTSPISGSRGIESALAGLETMLMR